MIKRGQNMVEKKPLLKCTNICKYFGVTKAVDHVDFELYDGEIRGLVGENGSGKSTLVSVIAAILERDDGEIEMDAMPYQPHNQIQANDLGVNMITQEMGTIDSLTIAENIYLGHEKSFMRFGLRDLKKMNKMAEAILANAGIEGIDPSVMAYRYNFEQRKAVELAKAIGFSPKILIVDETTTALSHESRELLYGIMKRLRAEGKSVIFISHDLQEVLGICDNVTVLKDGKLVGTYASKDMTENSLKHAMVGRELDEGYYRTDYGVPVSEEVVLEARNITIPNLLKNVTFELHKGEILGIGGLSEAGIHELGKVLFGINLDQTGEVYLPHKGVRINCITTAIKNGVGYLPKNRDQEGLMIEASIKDNINIANMDKINSGPMIWPHKANRFAEKHAQALKVKMINIDQFVGDLSGGNKQKVSLAKWLARDADIMVLDSPTRGIDVMVKAAIYHTMAQLKNSGISIVMISEELLELIGMCDRILVLANGHINGSFTRSRDLSEELIIEKMI